MQVLSRAELKKETNLGPRVFHSAAPFLSITTIIPFRIEDDEDSDDDDDRENDAIARNILDCTRIHPDDYMIAGMVIFSPPPPLLLLT